MNRIILAGLVVSVWAGAQAGAGVELELTATDLDRLGVELQPPEAVSEVVIAAGPAEIVIPPSKEAIVSSLAGGVLSRLLVAEGDSVAAGQPVAELTSAELLALQRAFVDAAVSADLLMAQHERDRGLFEDGIVSERRLQESQAALRAATTARSQASQQLRLAGLSDSDLQRLLDTGELDPTLTLAAPFAGVIVERLASLGARVDALDPVYRIADISELWLELHVPQESAARIAPGMRIVATSGAKSVTADIRQVSRIVDVASQTVQVRAGFANDDPALRAGQFLPARVVTSQRQNSAVLAVPAAAVVRDGHQAYVFAFRNNVLAVRPISIFAEDGTRTYIEHGLDADVAVATAGVAALKSVWMATAAEDE